MDVGTDHLESHHKELIRRLEHDRIELIRAAQALQPHLRQLDHAEKRVRQAAEALPVIAWGLAELTLAGVAIRWALQARRSGWVVLGLQAFRAWKALKDSAQSAQRAIAEQNH